MPPRVAPSLLYFQTFPKLRALQSLEGARLLG
jgi:hypothetical protein